MDPENLTAVAESNPQEHNLVFVPGKPDGSRRRRIVPLRPPLATPEPQEASLRQLALPEMPAPEQKPVTDELDPAPALRAIALDDAPAPTSVEDEDEKVTTPVRKKPRKSLVAKSAAAPAPVKTRRPAVVVEPEPLAIQEIANDADFCAYALRIGAIRARALLDDFFGELLED